MKLDLSGQWALAFENNNEKIEYKDTIFLPATTEQAALGKYVENPTSLYLGRKWPVCGKVWYKKKIMVPLEWKEYYVQLSLERTKFTKVWVNNKFIGESFETLVPQVYELGKLSTGEHELTIMVDNALDQYDCFPKSLYNGHQYTEHTQTNWNGILGAINLIGHKGIFIEQVLTIRNDNQLEIRVKTNEKEELKADDVFVEVSICQFQTKNAVFHTNVKLEKSKTSIVVSDVNFDLWDEYAQNLYDLEITLLDDCGNRLCNTTTLVTGIRKLETEGQELRINGERVSLRGSLDCAIYPLTGACPFTEAEWMNILEKMKSFGMNHYRFHSWCPPEAAFIAADKLGMYLQVELSCFANELYKKDDKKYDRVLEEYLYQQSKIVLETYGNHPSFILFAIGNEMRGNLEAYNDLLRVLKEVRGDILYSQGANNFLEDPIPCAEDEFWVTMRTKRGVNIRASFSHNDLPLGTIQSKEILGTLDNYEEAANLSAIPLISHEIGQFQSFPLLTDHDKYTGPLRGDVYEILENKLKVNGLLEKNKEFYEASGALLVECYKAEIEANLRTSNMSGFQLLGLQDFPGQGTALVGVLDCFFENKGFIDSKGFREFCNEVVVMATFPKYCYKMEEEINVMIYIYNYSGKNQIEKLTIELQENTHIIDSIVVEQLESKKQCVEKAYECKFSTNKINVPCEAKLHLEYGGYENNYSLWIYPKENILPIEMTEEIIVDNQIKKDKLDHETIDNQKIDNETIENKTIDNEIIPSREIGFFTTDEIGKSIWVTNTYNEKVNQILENNGKVLLCSSKQKNGIEGFFPTDFWCYPMFKEACVNSGNPIAPGTMGLLIDTKHPALKKFPTRSYSQWQWQQIVSHSCGVILDEEKDCKIIVQVIDNFDRNHVLGLVYEKQVKNGKLLVCSSDLLENLDIPEMRQLFISLVQ